MYYNLPAFSCQAYFIISIIFLDRRDTETVFHETQGSPSVTLKRKEKERNLIDALYLSKQHFTQQGLANAIKISRSSITITRIKSLKNMVDCKIKLDTSITKKIHSDATW